MLREQVGASQVDVAEALGTSQSNVSQLKRSNDQMLSSIAKSVSALGGELKMTAVVGNTTYTLLDDVGELAPRRTRPRRARSGNASTSWKAPPARAARDAPIAPKASAGSRPRKRTERRRRRRSCSDVAGPGWNHPCPRER